MHALQPVKKQIHSIPDLTFFSMESIRPTLCENCGFHSIRRQYFCLLGIQAKHCTHDNVWCLDPLQLGMTASSSHLDGQDTWVKDSLVRSEMRQMGNILCRSHQPWKTLGTARRMVSFHCCHLKMMKCNIYLLYYVIVIILTGWSKTGSMFDSVL